MLKNTCGNIFETAADVKCADYKLGIIKLADVYLGIYILNVWIYVNTFMVSENFQQCVAQLFH